ncbi:hypothetical protein HPO96_37195 [Kribbella sandramycini]|uniref:Uncharacterized protein n=1 Tax=Kribbella sandramycini TaxID=60450 RepID=A0A7Y4L9T0_9ACTN|nr:hypothetical protein [Kribbella sandramycini]MBB6564439.1 hypothetical protein [Kribbella sandramycini]NOL45897.1 hypothetical protein [Kribbella sandramycini]
MPKRKSLKEQRAELNAAIGSFKRVPNTGIFRSELYPGYAVGEYLGRQPYAVYRDGRDGLTTDTAYTFEGAVAIVVNLSAKGQ